MQTQEASRREWSQLPLASGGKDRRESLTANELKFPTDMGVVLPIGEKRRADDLGGLYLAFQHVSHAFGSNQVLNDVSFAVMPGETLCILGRSGAGKSVSLRLFMGFLKPCAGRVIAAHEDITDYTEQELERIHKKVTMVFQTGALFDSLTAAENVAFPLRERGELDEEQIDQIVDGLLEMVNARSLRDSHPGEISTGAKRLVAIARALAAEPEAILYDEPTTNVDPLDGAPAWRTDKEIEAPVAANQRSGDSRYEAGGKSCRSRGIPRWRQSDLLRDQRRDGTIVSSAGPTIPAT
jgi:ABC-type polar amino acid transport system ATPase subunit